MKIKNKIKVSLSASILTALILSLFLKLLEIASGIFNDNIQLILLLPIIGLLIRFSYKKYGKGSIKANQVILNSLKNKTEIPLVLSIIAPISTLFAHLFGASIGREGIGIQVGSSIYYSLSKLFKLNDNDIRLMTICGISCGFGVIFNTPLSGIVFGLEFSNSKLRDLKSIPYTLLGSFTGMKITRLFGISHFAFKVTEQVVLSFKTVIVLIFIAFLIGILAFIFIKTVGILKKIFTKYFINEYRIIWVASLLLVIFVNLTSNSRYQGLGTNLINEAFLGDVLWYDSLMKLLATTLSISGGFVGGEVTPLFAIGASFGSVLAKKFMFPASVGASLGFIGMFSSAAKVPLTGITLGIELFGIQGLLCYIIVCFIGYKINKKDSIYTI